MFVDCIRTADEAKAIIEIGILPTHVIHIIPPFSPPLNKILYCHVPVGWPEYRRSVLGIRDVFKHCLQVILILSIT